MLRAGCKATKVLNNGTRHRSHGNVLNSRPFSTGNPSGNGGFVRLGFGLIAVSSVTIAGGTVYAKSNPSFRKNVEGRLPITEGYFNYVLGVNIIDSQSTILKVDPLEKVKFSESRKPKIVKEEKVQSDDVKVNETVESKPIDTNESPHLKENVEKDSEPQGDNILNEKLLETTPLPVPEPLLERIETKIVEEIEKGVISLELKPENNVESVISDSTSESTDPLPEPQINAAVSVAILKDLLSDCSVACSTSVLTDNEAVQAIKFYSSVLRRALEDHSVTLIEKSKQWAAVKDAKAHRDGVLEKADSDYHRAIEELTKIGQILEATKMNSGDPGLKKTILDVQQSCEGMSKDLEKSKAEIRKHEEETSTLARYQSLISDARDRFREEIKAHLPELSMDSSWGEVSVTKPPNTDPALVSELQNLVDSLNEELRSKKAEFEARVKEAEENFKHKMEKEALEELVSKSERILKNKFEEKLRDISERHEEDVKLQLKRQTTAHAEHLADALAYMEKQAKAKYEIALRESESEQQKEFVSMIEEQRNCYEQQTNELRERYQTEMSLAFARVRGVIQAVDGHADLENVTRKAQELSLACDALNVTLKYGDKGEPVPLNAELDTLKRLSAEDPMVSSLISEIPEQAIERGVYPEKVLQSAFDSVAKLCRRLSLVDESRNSLFVYFMSYLKSLLMFTSQVAPPAELDEKSQNDVFRLMAYAKYCISQGDIEQAVRFTNQLTGESRKAAETWLKEARLFLETQQTIDSLSAISAAIFAGVQIED